VVTAASTAPERRGETEGKEDDEEAKEVKRASVPPLGDGEPGFWEEAPSWFIVVMGQTRFLRLSPLKWS